MSAANVSSASPHIAAPTSIASVPLASSGAWNSILPNTSLSTIVVSGLFKLRIAGDPPPVSVKCPIGETENTSFSSPVMILTKLSS